jgi:hypothetical protein
LTFNKSTNTLTVTGGANLGNLATANYVAGVRLGSRPRDWSLDIILYPETRP